MKLSLRTRLLLGQLAPVLLLPLLSFLLVYLLAVKVWIPSIASDIMVEGNAILAASRQGSGFWADPAQAQDYLDRLVLHPKTQVVLIDSGAKVLASTRANQNRTPSLNALAAPNVSDWQVTPAILSSKPVLDVTIPVVGANNQVIGYILLYRSLEEVHAGLEQAILYILFVLAVGVVLSTFIGIWQARHVALPIQHISQVISEAPLEGETSPVAEDGPQEFRVLIQAYNRLQERRVHLEEARQQMMANLVHELGRPLGSLQAALHAMRSGASDDPILRGEILQGMTERINIMSRLVEDLAQSYRKTLSLWELNRQPIAPVSWLRVLTPLWAERARQTGLSWQAHIPLELPMVLMDAERMGQALTNVVDNAIKFTPRGGVVKLDAGYELEKVWFRVTDSGPGIPLEQQARIFEPFYRVINPEWKAPGLGLGLSITRTIVEAHGGGVAVKSEPGQGSQFILWLPVLNSEGILQDS